MRLLLVPIALWGLCSCSSAVGHPRAPVAGTCDPVVVDQEVDRIQESLDHITEQLGGWSEQIASAGERDGDADEADIPDPPDPPDVDDVDEDHDND